MIGDLKKKRWPFCRVVVLKRVEACSRCQTWAFSGNRGGWNDSVLWTLWNKMVTVLARGFGRCRRRRVSVQVFRIRTRLESLSGFVLLSLLLRTFTPPSTSPPPPSWTECSPTTTPRRSQCFRSKNFQLCLLLSSHVEIGEATSPAFSGFFLSFSAKYIWEE